MHVPNRQSSPRQLYMLVDSRWEAKEDVALHNSPNDLLKRNYIALVSVSDMEGFQIGVGEEGLFPYLLLNVTCLERRLYL